MAQPDSLTKLRRAHRTLSEGIRASEAWHDDYRKHPEVFKALLMLESQLELDVADYLHDLSERAPAYVDWSHYGRLAADASPVINKGDPVWDAEQLDFQRAIMDAISSLVAVGGQAAEIAYGIDMGTTVLSESVLEAARKQVATLVSGVTDTSRDLIRAALKQSIARGEDTAQAIERIRLVINNPVRAALIAQTESVNAYQTGIYNFAVETGAKTKTWQTTPGACPICLPVDEKTIDRDDLFVLGNGREVLKPTGHPKCRCGVRYGY